MYNFNERFMGHAYKLPRVRASRRIEWWERSWEAGLFIGFDEGDLGGILPGYDVVAWKEHKLGRPYTPDRIDVKEVSALGNAFIVYTCYCLDLIATTEPGARLLSALSASGKTIVVTPSYTGGNQYRVQSPKKALAVSSLLVKDGSADLAELMEAAALAEGSKKDPQVWLFDKVSASWLHTNFGMLPVAGKVLPEQIEDEDRQEALNVQRRVLKTAPAKLPLELFRTWLGARVPDSLEGYLKDGSQRQALHEHLQQAVIMALYWTSKCHEGSDTIVDFAPGLSAARPDDKDEILSLRKRLLAERPPAIGLAHELIHAYYDAYGMQPDSPDTNIVLTEMACVGLGPWSNPFAKDPVGADVIAENAIRDAWLSQSTLQNFNGEEEDPVNLRPWRQPRKYYAWDEAKHTGSNSKSQEKCVMM